MCVCRRDFLNVSFGQAGDGVSPLRLSMSLSGDLLSFQEADVC